MFEFFLTNHYAQSILVGAVLAFLFLWNRARIRNYPKPWLLIVGLMSAAPFVLFGARLWTVFFDYNLANQFSGRHSFGEQIAIFFGFSSGTFNIAGLSYHGAFWLVFFI